MTIPELINAIGEKHKNDGFVARPPVSDEMIAKFEKKLGFAIPDDFRKLYSICNGFEVNEDSFKLAEIDEILKYYVNKKEKTFHFADYMTYSDMWTLKYFGEANYKIVNFGNIDIILTDSLAEFLSRFLSGGIFENGGLYDWHEEIKRITP